MTVLKIRVDSADEEHVKITLFAGEQGKTLSNIGNLCMSVGEYQIIGAVMSLGAKSSNGHLIMIHDDKAFDDFCNRVSV